VQLERRPHAVRAAVPARGQAVARADLGHPVLLGPRLGLTPSDAQSQLAALQYQPTIADFVGEAHDTHHPLGVGLYYEDQKQEARARGAVHRRTHAKFLGYFERATQARSAAVMSGARHSYVDLSLFR
jgi:glutathione S-transferase